MKKNELQIIRKLEKVADRPWYLPLVASLAAADLFVGFIPTDAVLVASVMFKPKRWLATTIWITLGSALGAIALGACVQQWGQPFTESILGDFTHSETWQSTDRFIDEYGSLGLALISASPFPQQPAVAICGLAGMSLSLIFFSVLSGRAAKYLVFGLLAARAPKLIQRWGIEPTDVKQIQKVASAQKPGQKKDSDR